MKQRLFFLLPAALAFASCNNDDGGKTPPAAVRVTGITLGKAALNIAAGGNERLSVTEVLPADATDRSVCWITANSAVATVDSEGLVSVPGTAAEGAKTTITAIAHDGSGVKAACNVTVNGVTVNGVAWARCNVDAEGTFATSPESYGKVFQWNRKKGWKVSNPMIEWDNTWPTGDAWEPANNPCPAGWRIPTREELASLLDSGKVTIEMVNGMNGRRFTDKASGISIFLPTAGACAGSGIPSSDRFGLYWSGTVHSDSFAWNLHIQEDVTVMTFQTFITGLSIRCVRQ